MSAKRDYYEILGLDKKATDASIKKAYRKLAKKYHPDSNPNDKEAEKRFKEVTEAYNVLSDKEKKKLQRLYHILELIKDLNGKDTKEHAILELMEYDIDAEVEEEIVEYIEKDAGKVKEQLDRIEHKASSLENKMSKFKQFLPELRLLEFEEVKYIYQQYLPEFKIEYEIVSQMIRDEKIYQKTLNPEKFKEYYNNYKDGMEIVYEEIAASVNPEESF